MITNYYLLETSYIGTSKSKSNTLFGKTVDSVLTLIQDLGLQNSQNKQAPFPNRLAVVGPRGSGKTSVIRMVQQRIKEDEEDFRKRYLRGAEGGISNKLNEELSRSYLLEMIIDPTIFRESNSMLQAIVSLLFAEFLKRAKKTNDSNSNQKVETEKKKDEIIRLFEQINKATYFEAALEPSSHYEDASYVLSDFAELLRLNENIEKLITKLLEYFSLLDFSEERVDGFCRPSYQRLLVFIDDFDLCPKNLPLAIKQIINFFTTSQVLMIFSYDKDSLDSILKDQLVRKIDTTRKAFPEGELATFQTETVSAIRGKFISPICEIDVKVNEDNKLYRSVIPLLLVDDGMQQYQSATGYISFLNRTLGNPPSIRKANSCLNLALRERVLLHLDLDEQTGWSFGTNQTDAKAAELIRQIYNIPLSEEELDDGFPKELGEMLYYPLASLRVKKNKIGAQKAFYKQRLFRSKYHSTRDFLKLVIRGYDDIIIACPASAGIDPSAKIGVYRFSDHDDELSGRLFYVMSVFRNVFASTPPDRVGICKEALAECQPLSYVDSRLINQTNIDFTAFFFSESFGELFAQARSYLVTLHNEQRRRPSPSDVESGRQALIKLFAYDQMKYFILESSIREIVSCLKNHSAIEDESVPEFAFIREALLDFEAQVNEAKKR